MADKRSVLRRDVLGWSLYDFANTIYSMNIVSLYLKRYIVEDLHYDDRYFDIPFSISMVFAAALLPALGAISDHSSKRRVFLFLFTLTCCAAVGLMSLVPSSAVLFVIVLFIIANFAYEAGQPFYNALLYSVADGRQARFVSGLGVAMGYVGSIVGMILVLPFVSGAMWGVDVPFLEGGGKPAAFLPTAVLFMLFSIPIFLWVKEKPNLTAGKTSFVKAYREVWDGVRLTRKYPGVLRFLIADYFFEDAVTTVILNMGIYCSIVIGLANDQITTFLIISTVAAVIGSFGLGKLAERWALKPLLNLIMWGWALCLVLFVVADSMWVIWVLGSLLGILLGGLWTTTRPLLAEMVPRSELGRFFGLFSLSGRAAAIVGPLIWTLAVYLFDTDRYFGKMTAELLELAPADYVRLPYKMGVVSLIIMVLAGLAIFRKVPEQRQDHDG